MMPQCVCQDIHSMQIEKHKTIDLEMIQIH